MLAKGKTKIKKVLVIIMIIVIIMTIKIKMRGYNMYLDGPKDKISIVLVNFCEQRKHTLEILLICVTL